MKITSVDVVNLRYDYPQGAGFACAEGATDARVSSLVLVSTDEGLTGVGSAYSHPDIVRLIVEQHLRPFLVGEDPADVEGLWDRMYSLTRWYGRKGAAVSALGAVDIALWDIRGKTTGKAVYRLLGGGDPEVMAYASGLLWQDDLELLAAEADGYADSGYRLVKMRLGRDRSYDRAGVDSVLNALNGRALLAVDGTHRYTLEEAIDLSTFLSDRGVAWFEGPFPPEDIDAYASLRSCVGVPIAAGENEFGLQGFRELICAAAVDIAQPDASRAGGITDCFRIAQLAANHDVRVVTHTWSDAVALVANAHLVAAAATGWAVEVDTTGTPLMERLAVEGFPVAHGSVTLSDEPGLGIELDPAIVSDLTVEPSETVRDGNYADLAFGRQTYEVVPPRVRSST